MSCKYFYTAKEAAEVLGVHPETIRRNVREGKIPSLKVFRKILIPAGFFSYADADPCRGAERQESGT